jgi:RimJ/RimL family protein N-acetyltransferase
MDLLAGGMSLHCLPRRFASKSGAPLELQVLPAGDDQRLIDMYLAFRPRNCFQGLPPLRDAVCIGWVRQMLRTGVNIMAHGQPTGIVGHAALFPINQQKCELLVAVCPGYQNVGIGTELVRACIDVADELGFEQVWLPVEATNVRARHIYQKCGFEYVSTAQCGEVDMVCQVRRHRTPPPITASFYVVPTIDSYSSSGATGG